MAIRSGLNKWRDRVLIWEYFVYHKDDTENKVRLRTLRKLTTCEIKEKIVNNGLFHRGLIKELRVERISP